MLKAILPLSKIGLNLVSLIGFYGISTFVGDLMPNPFFIQIVSSISNNSV